MRALPSSPSSGVFFILLDSSTELWMCPGCGGMGARLPGCCDSMIMSTRNCGKWHQFCEFLLLEVRNRKLHENRSMIEIARNI